MSIVIKGNIGIECHGASHKHEHTLEDLGYTEQSGWNYLKQEKDEFLDSLLEDELSNVWTRDIVLGRRRRLMNYQLCNVKSVTTNYQDRKILILDVNVELVDGGDLSMAQYLFPFLPSIEWINLRIHTINVLRFSSLFARLISIPSNKSSNT